MAIQIKVTQWSRESRHSIITLSINSLDAAADLCVDWALCCSKRSICRNILAKWLLFCIWHDSAVAEALQPSQANKRLVLYYYYPRSMYSSPCQLFGCLILCYTATTTFGVLICINVGRVVLRGGRRDQVVSPELNRTLNLNRLDGFIIIFTSCCVGGYQMLTI